MTQEEKELLTKDVCSRIPYHLKVNYADKVYDVLGYTNNKLIIVLPFMSNLEGHPVETCKSYLRPMESMTEEEKEYVKNRWCYENWSDIHDFLNNYEIDAVDAFYLVDWMTANHFDYRGLIGKGLALPAPEGMYNN